MDHRPQRPIISAFAASLGIGSRVIKLSSGAVAEALKDQVSISRYGVLASSRFGVWGLGFGVWGLGFGVWGLGSSFCKPNPHTAAASSPASAPSACAAASGFILPRIFCSPCSGATQPERTSSVLDFPYVRSRHAGATTCNPSHASHNPQLTDDTQAAAALLAGSRDTR